MKPLTMVAVGTLVASIFGVLGLANTAESRPPMPPVREPAMFDTPEADRVLAALPVFPPNNPWNQDVSSWPVHPNSRNIIASIGADKPLRHNSDMGFVLVPPHQKRVPVKIALYPAESDQGPFPVPDNLPIEGWPVNYRGKNVTLDDVQRDKLHEGGDRHGIIVDPVNLQALRVLPGAQDRRRLAGFAGVGVRSEVEQAPPGRLDLGRCGGPADLSGGRALRRVETRHGGACDARHGAADAPRRTSIPPRTTPAARTIPTCRAWASGIRLKQNYAIEGFSPSVRAILKGLKKYGMFVADNGLDWDISVAPDPRIPPMHEELRRIKGSAFEVVEPPK